MPSRFRYPVDSPSHPGSNAKDVAPRPRGECSPIIDGSDAGGDQPIKQELLGEFGWLLIAEFLVPQISAHGCALTIS
jgi:hypothetical protein